MKARLTAISFGFAAVAAIVLFVVPVYSGFTDSQPVRATLIEINGKWVIVPVILPVVIAVVPLVFRKQVLRIIATVIMLGFTIISGFSIGLLYLPAAMMMLLAACVADSAKLRDVLP